MKRIIAIGALVGALVVPALPAAARPAGRIASPSGSVSGGTRYVPGEGCPFQHQQFLFAVTLTNGRTGALYLNGCTYPDAGGSDVYPYAGVFTMWLSRGALTGTVEGVTAHDLTTSVTVDMTLTVTGGTGRLQGTTGTVSLAGTWDASAPPSPDPARGTFTSALSR